MTGHNCTISTTSSSIPGTPWDPMSQSWLGLGKNHHYKWYIFMQVE